MNRLFLAMDGPTTPQPAGFSVLTAAFKSTGGVIHCFLPLKTSQAFEDFCTANLSECPACDHTAGLHVT